MNLVVTKPQNRLGLFTGGFDRIFEDFFRLTPWTDSEQSWAPRADIHETENDYLVQLDLPGLDKKDVKIKVEDNYLVISGERKSEHETNDENYHRLERITGTFSRSFQLHQDVAADKIKANFKNGVLEVRIPKTEEVKPKQIAID